MWGSTSWSLLCWSCRYVKGFLIRGWDIILPVSGTTSTLARAATFAARWLNKSQPISNQPEGLEFLHCAGRHRPGRSPFSSPGCWSSRGKQGFLIRGWEIILLGCGRTSTLARGETLAARWLHESQPISNEHQQRASAVRISTPFGAVSIREITVFVPGCWIVEIWMDL